MGFYTRATGNYSVALGSYVWDSRRTGVFIIGDSSNFVTQPNRNNQFVARFKGGYNLYTDDSGNRVYLDSGATSWQYISDSTMKTNFVKADGEYF